MSNPFILYDNLFVDGTPSSTSTDSSTGYAAANINDYRQYTWWRGNSSGDHFLEVDAGSAQNVNTLGLLGHNFNTVGAAVSVESSTSGAWGGEQTVRLSTFASTDDYAKIKTFSSAAARYWRLRMIGCSTKPTLAVAFLGVRTAFPSQVMSNPGSPVVPRDISVEYDSEVSKAGYLLGSVIRHKPYTIDVDFKFLASTWVNTTFKTFWDNHGSLLKPFFLMLDSSAYPNEVNYVYMDAPKYNPTRHYSTRYESLSLRVRGTAE